MLPIRPLCLLALLALSSTHAYAQTNELWVRVLNYTGAREPRAKICTNERGDGCRMDSTGRVRITLPPEVGVDSEVELTVLNKEYVLIDPWANKVRVPANRANDVVVRVFRVGDRRALESGFVLQALLRMINYKTQASGLSERRSIDPRKAALAFIARSSGFTPEQLGSSIERQRQRVSAGEKGQYALYEGEYRQAEEDLLRSRSAAGQERRELAKDAFFLGQAQFQLGKYREAEQSLLQAQTLGMTDDTSLLDYLGAIALLKGNNLAGVRTFEKSVALKEKSPDKHPGLLASRVGLVGIYLALERESEAQEQLKKIWMTCEESLAKDFDNTAPALINLIIIYKMLGEQSGLEFDSEISWLKNLVDAAAEKEIRNQRSHQIKADALLIQISAEQVTSDDPFPDRKELQEKALALLRELKSVLGETSRTRRHKGSSRRGGSRHASPSRTTARSASKDAANAILTMLFVSEILSDEKTAKQLRNEVVVQIKKTINQDPVWGLYALASIAQSYLNEGAPEAESLYQIVWTTAENSSAIENPLVADKFFEAAISYYIRELKVENIKPLFDRIEDVSKKSRKSSHAWDAALLAVLATKLQAMDEDYEELVREMVESPIHIVMEHAAENLIDPSGPELESYVKIANLCADAGKYDDAKILFSMVRNKVEENWGSQHSFVRQCLIGIAKVERSQGLKDDAESTYRQAIANERKRQGASKKFMAALLEQ